MNIITEDIKSLLSFFRGPINFVRNVQMPGFLSALRQSLMLLGVLTGGVALATWLNYDDFLKVSRAQMEAFAINAAVAQGVSPWRNVLVLPLMAITLFSLVGFSRHIMAKLMGEEQASMARTQSLTIYSLLPLLVVGALSSIVRILHPEMPAPGQMVAFTVQETLLTLFLIAALIFDMLLCIQALKAQYAQKTGRALLTYLAPMILCNLSCVGFGLILAVMIMGQAGLAS